MKFFFLFLLTLFLLGCTKTSLPQQPKQYATYLSESDLKKLDFAQQELLTIQMKGEWYYVRADGKSMLAITNEVGEADKFKEGMARTRINGKIGFFNQSLDMVLAPMYDYAFPFYDGVAEICMGCKESVEEGNSILDGGTWKRINRSGLVLEE